MLVLVINYKVYPSAFGSRALEIAKEADKVARDYAGTLRVIVAPPHTEIARISSIVEHVDVYAQHVDPVDPGAHTGSIPPEAIKEAGAKGSILNHSEKRMLLEDISAAVDKLRRLGLEQLVCASTPRTAAAAATLQPTYIAVEPPELIGTGVAVSRAKPHVIVESVKAVQERFGIPLLVGAGIVSFEDAKRSVELGAQGILVASTVMKSSEPGKKIRELAEGLLRGLEGRDS